MCRFFAITFLTLTLATSSYQEQMTRELQQLNAYLEQEVAVEVPPVEPVAEVEGPEGQVLDLYEQVGERGK